MMSLRWIIQEVRRLLNRPENDANKTVNNQESKNSQKDMFFKMHRSSPLLNSSTAGINNIETRLRIQNAIICGNHLTSRLLSYSPTCQDVVQMLINDILQSADRGLYETTLEPSTLSTLDSPSPILSNTDPISVSNSLPNLCNASKIVCSNYN